MNIFYACFRCSRAMYLSWAGEVRDCVYRLDCLLHIILRSAGGSLTDGCCDPAADVPCLLERLYVILVPWGGSLTDGCCDPVADVTCLLERLYVILVTS